MMSLPKKDFKASFSNALSMHGFTKDKIDLCLKYVEQLAYANATYISWFNLAKVLDIWFELISECERLIFIRKYRSLHRRIKNSQSEILKNQH